MGAFDQNKNIREERPWSKFKLHSFAVMEDVHRQGNVVIFPVIFGRKGTKQAIRDFRVCDTAVTDLSYRWEDLLALQPEDFPTVEFELKGKSGKTLAIVSAPMSASSKGKK